MVRFVVAIASLGAGLSVSTLTAARQDGGFELALRFSVTDTRDFTFDLGRDLVVKATRAVDANGQQFGWDLAVHDRRIPKSPNFFYDCLCGHGPRPHDLYAWHFAKKNGPFDYGADRKLPVWGYPYTVRVVCEKCEVEGSGHDVRFASGTVSISWKRSTESHPRQLRIYDIVKRRF